MNPGHNLMCIQPDSKPRQSFNAESVVKNVLRVMVPIGNQERHLGPKLMLIIFKNNDILIIINHTVM